MKTIWKLVIISAAAGIALMAVGFFLGASSTFYLDRTGIHIADYSEEYRISEPSLGNIKSFYIDADYCDIEFVREGRLGVEAVSYGMEWDWSVEKDPVFGGDALIIKQGKKSDFHLTFNIGVVLQPSQRNYIKIYLPHDARLGIIDIKTSSGNIDISDFYAGIVSVSNSFGDVGISSVECSVLTISLDSGDFKGTELSAQTLAYDNNFGDGRFRAVKAWDFTADCDSGELELNGCELDKISVKNSFGKIQADGLVTQNVNIKADSGDIILDGDFKGETVIRSSFGDITLNTTGARDDYSYDISVQFGNIRFDGDRVEASSSLKGGGASGRQLKITASSGDIEVGFTG